MGQVPFFKDPTYPTLEAGLDILEDPTYPTLEGWPAHFFKRTPLYPYPTFYIAPTPDPDPSSHSV